MFMLILVLNVLDVVMNETNTEAADCQNRVYNISVYKTK